MTDLRDYKTYLVTLEITIGSYEKHTHTLVEAANADDAHARAFELEQHDDSAEWDYDMEAFVDCNGEMAYRVCSCVEVPWKDATVLRKYL